MNEKPILFSGPMVRGILEGQKTQTRRVIKSPSKKYPYFRLEECYPSEMGSIGNWRLSVEDEDGFSPEEGFWYFGCPYGQPGDRLWVKETYLSGRKGRIYKADHPIANMIPRKVLKWKSPIFMPKSAARLWLKIKKIRIERIQDISEKDAEAEGTKGLSRIEGYGAAWASIMNKQNWGPYKCGFALLWNKINKKRGYDWEKNPWVWVVEFKKVNHANKN